MGDRDFRKDAGPGGIAQALKESPCSYAAMKRHCSEIPGTDGLFHALHKFGADPLPPMIIIDRKLPRLRDAPGKSDHHASDHPAPVIYGNKMDLLFLIARILLGQMKS